MGKLTKLWQSLVGLGLVAGSALAHADNIVVIPQNHVTNFPNEKIGLQTRTLKLEYRDVYIPGHAGMDIVVTRRHAGAAFGVSSFGMKTTHVFADADPAITTTCLGTVKRISIGYDGEGLVPNGYASNNDVPSDVIAAFHNNGYLSCDSEDDTVAVFNLPDGKKFKLIQVRVISTTHSNIHYYKIKTISDRFGNVITYEYENDPLPDRSDRIKSISRNDGTVVNFVYEPVDGNFGSGYHPERLSQINWFSTKDGVTMPSRDVQYEYYPGSIKLETFTDSGGRKTTYEYARYTGIGTQITGVTTPDGLKVSYEHTPIIDNGSMRRSGEVSASGGHLIAKTITGPGIEPRRYAYNSLPNNRILVTQFNYKGDLDYTTEYQFEQATHTNLNGRLKKIRIFEGVLSQEGAPWLALTDDQHPQVYERSIIAKSLGTNTHGCSVTTRIGNKPLDCTTYVNDMETISVFNQGGKDTYTVDFKEYNTYGEPLKWKEVFGVNTKWQTRSFTRDLGRWHINLPRLTQLGDSENSLEPELEQTYYSDTHGSYAFLPFEKKVFGVWQFKVSEYDSHGNIGKIEHNSPLTFGETAANRYTVFEDYFRGRAQMVRKPGRYGGIEVYESKVVLDTDYGMTIQSTDYNGTTTFYGYDKLGRPLFVDPVDASRADLFYEYVDGSESSGPATISKNCTLNTDRTACVSTLVTTTEYFDAAGNLKKAVKNDNRQSVFQLLDYNSFDQKVFESYLSYEDGETNGQRYEYDALQRITSFSKSGGGSITTDYLTGNRVKVTDARGNRTTTTYQAFGTPTYEKATKIVSPEYVTTDIEVNVFGEVSSILQSGYRHGQQISERETRLYNNLHQLCMVKRNDVGNTYFSYDALGQVSWQASGVSGQSCANDGGAAAEQRINFTYDNLGGRRTVEFGDTTADRTFTLDNNGNIKSVVTAEFTQSYEYNSNNALLSESLEIVSPGKSFTMQYEYDSLGTLSTIKYPGDNSPIRYSPDAFGRATKAVRDYGGGMEDVYVQPGAAYHANGIIKSFTYGNGVEHRTSLNIRGIPQSIEDDRNGVSIVGLTYDYDNNNNIVSLHSSRDNGAYSLDSLAYDGLDRLTTVAGGTKAGSSQLSYDGLGNILSYSNTSTEKSHNLTYTYDASNRLSGLAGEGSAGYDFKQQSAQGGDTFDSYDARGNVVHNGKRNFKYNLAGQMVESGDFSYLYDGFNRRIRSTNSNGASYSFYSRSGRLLYRETDKGAIRYVFFGNRLVAKEGSAVDSQSAGDANYKPFGESIGEAKDDIGFTGHKFDTDLGLSYMQARYYDPVIGRFMSNDPVGSLGHDNIAHGFNRYAYANNNPYKYIDPTGEIPLVVVAIWILKEVGGEVFEQTTGIPAPTVKNIAKYGMKEAMKQSIKNRKKIEGVYKFKEGDKEYIGQSQDVMRRVKQHAGNKEKFAEDKAGSLQTKEVKGGKLEREKAEQGLIDDATGGRGAASDKVSNKVNPCRREECS